MVHVLVVQLSARRVPSSEPALMRAFGLRLTEVNASSCCNNRTSHSILKLFLQSLCAPTTVQVTDCMQYIASNGINPVLHAAVFIMQSAPYLSQGNYLCSLYCNSVLNTEYCLEFSRKLYFWTATRLKWDPGVHVVLHSYTATRPGTFAHVLQPIFASAISCSYAFALGWTEVNVQQLRDPSLKLLVTHESRKEYAYTVGFLNGQCKYIHQRGVQENHNAKQLLISSKNCLHIWKVDILFTTFLPP